ncbi:hypothetical protein RhiJN_24730 [Ceratobasidium sp. AG-Ba]|nr:hypothetical protein RhiJN_24730 [Ceratobasidium sp. AG-Ba]
MAIQTQRGVTRQEQPRSSNPIRQYQGYIILQRRCPSPVKQCVIFIHAQEFVMHPAYGQPDDQFTEFFPNDFIQREASSSSQASAFPLQGSENNTYTSVDHTIDPAQITGVEASSMPPPGQYANAEGLGLVIIPHHDPSETNQTADTSALQLSGLNTNTQPNSDEILGLDWDSGNPAYADQLGPILAALFGPDDDFAEIDLSQPAVITVPGYGVLKTKEDVDKYIKWLKIKRKPRILTPETPKPGLDCPVSRCDNISRRPIVLREHLYAHLGINRKTSEL